MQRAVLVKIILMLLCMKIINKINNVNLPYDPLLFCRLHEVTSSKIVFIKNEEHLAEYIPLHVLPKSLF